MTIRIKVAEDIEEIAKELSEKESAYRGTILDLSHSASVTNRRLWKLLKKYHPEIKPGEIWRLDQDTMEIYRRTDEDKNDQSSLL